MNNQLLSDTKLAIELEKKGYELYSQTSAKTTNPLAKNVFSSLADRELIHLEKIKEFYKSLSGEATLKSDWLKGTSIPMAKNELLKTITEKLKQSLSKEFTTQSDINEAYLVAEGLERDSYTFYEKISKESTDELVKKFYMALAQEEREHYDILDETQLYLNDPQEWFRRQEKWIVEG
ncbi:MAG: ferritin family protein [Candidatus Margulisiibacteriota bacterium]